MYMDFGGHSSSQDMGDGCKQAAEGLQVTGFDHYTSTTTCTLFYADFTIFMGIIMLSSAAELILCVTKGRYELFCFNSQCSSHGFLIPQEPHQVQLCSAA